MKQCVPRNYRSCARSFCGGPRLDELSQTCREQVFITFLSIGKRKHLSNAKTAGLHTVQQGITNQPQQPSCVEICDA